MQKEESVPPTTVDVDRLVDTKAGLVDRRIFADQQLYELEQARVFARAWLFVGHENQIPKPLDFITGYMAEDPVIVTRDESGDLHVVLNVCRHRGNRVCQEDQGNAKSFVCSYHGWTYDCKGALVSVPAYKEAYFGELDTDKYGLIRAPRVESYAGLIFATWDKDAPSLIEYLGDMTYYLRLIADRREGGLEILGVHKWMVDANWKFAQENFAGDSYHTPITHMSAFGTGFGGRNRPRIYRPESGFMITPGNGHGVGGRWAEDEDVRLEMMHGLLHSEIVEYEREHWDELNQRVGKEASKIVPAHGGVFPNLGLIFWNRSIRVFHPRGPCRTEIWSYSIVDKVAPPQVKHRIRSYYTDHFGPGGNFEQDDMDNWMDCTGAARGYIGKQYPVHIGMGVGHDGPARHNLPAKECGLLLSDTNHRAFYGMWQKLVSAPTWADVPLDPRTEQSPIGV